MYLRLFSNRLLFLYLSVFLLLAGGCRKPLTNVEKGLRDQELYVGIQTSPTGLDPHIATGIMELYITLSLLEGLVTRNPETLAIEPGVAKSWTVSPDGKTYTFNFDPEARWSNGDPVTPADFVFSFKRILSPALGAANAYMLYPIKGAEAFNTGKLEDFSAVGVKALDSETLQIQLEAPTPYLLSLLTHQSWWPVHQPTIIKYGAMTNRSTKWTQAGNFVGNGPFILESWKLNAPITVKKNLRYRSAESVRLNRVHFLPISIDPEERAFRAGYLHVTYNVPTHRIEWYNENAPERIRFDTYLGTYYYGLNVTKGPLKDARVRKALAYSIDREAITDHVMRAGEKPAYHFTPPNTGGYSANEGFQYDPERARKLLAEAGYPGGKGFPKLELLYNTSEEHLSVAIAIQQMWKKELGIDITLYNQEWKAYIATRKKGAFDIMRAGWIGDYDDANTFLGLATSSSGNNHTKWSDPAYDALIKMANQTTDTDERNELFRQAEQLLMDQMPIIPLFFYVRGLLIDPTVRGWHPNVLDYHPYNNIYLEKVAE